MFCLIWAILGVGGGLGMLTLAVTQLCDHLILCSAAHKQGGPGEEKELPPSCYLMSPWAPTNRAGFIFPEQLAFGSPIPPLSPGAVLEGRLAGNQTLLPGSLGGRQTAAASPALCFAPQAPVTAQRRSLFS